MWKIFLCILIVPFGVYSQDWHMIAGGWNEDTSSLSSVELFNWKTGDQCIMSSELPRDLSAHSGAVWYGAPVVCGGLSNFEPQDRCYQYDSGFGSWSQFSPLLEETYFGVMINVPINKNIFVIGGNSLTKAQKLSDINGVWTEGPDLYNNDNEIGQCVVQIDDSTTAFLGGSNNQYKIVTLDWTTMKYTKREAILNGQRSHSACTLAKNEKGEPVVVIAGGRNFGSTGMEMWNPLDDSVITLAELLPQEEANNRPLQNAFMISINDGNEVLIYGGYEGTATQRGVYKFSMIDKTWSLIGDLLVPRDDHLVLAVDGITCQ